MDYGLKALEELLEIIENMTEEEYLELYEKLKENKDELQRKI